MSDSGLLSDADVGLGQTATSAPHGLMSDADVGLSPQTNSTAKDVAGGAAAGVVNGVSGLIGMPRAIKNAADYGGNWLIGKGAELAGLLPNGQTASDFATSAAAQRDAALKGLPQPPSTSDVRGAISNLGAPDYQPQTTAGSYAKTVGEFLPGAVAMPAEGLAGIAGNAVKYGVVPALASETAGQLTSGTPYEPYARTAAGLVGGVGSDLAVAGGKAAVNAGKAFVEPMTEAGQTAIAARKLRGQFSDPEFAQAALQEGADAAKPGQGIGENVPGSKPTTGQYLGDMGALSLERELATKQPELAKSNPFGTGSEQQNAARTSALNGIQPVGSPEEVGATVRQQLADIEAQHDATVQAATEKAASASDTASSATNAAATGADAAQAARETAATQAAQDAASTIGTGAAPEALGANMRQALQTARDAAKVKERALWNAVDPDGTLAMPSGGVGEAAAKIAGGISPTAKPMSGEESAIFATAQNLPDVVPFNDVTALRSRISTEMRNELRANGQTPTYARLTQLRGAVEDAISGAVENKAAAEAQAVAKGAMEPEEAMAAHLKAETDAFKQTRALAAGQSSGANTTGFAGSGSAGVSGAARTEVPGNGRLGNPTGDQSVPLTPNLDEAAAQRLKAASAATKERAQTFDQGPVGAALKSKGQAGDYAVPNSAVPAKLLVPGPKGAETVQAFGKAAGTLQPVMDAAAESLRREAMTPEGVIDPAKFAKWRTKHQDALRALPSDLKAKFENAATASQAVDELAAVRKDTVEPLQHAAESLTREAMTDGVLDPKKFARWQAKHADAIAAMPADVRAKLSDAGAASKAVAEASEARKTALDDFQKSVAGRFVGVHAPEDVTKTVSGIFGTKSAVRDMSDLAKRVAGNPDAKEGLRKAVADFILSKAKGTTEAGASGIENLNASTFQKFLRDNAATIKAAGFSDRELGSMQAIAQDLRRSQRTLQATRLPGQSNTAQDIIKSIEAANGAHPVSLLNKIAIGAGAGWETGGLHGALAGAGLGLGEHVIAGMRNAGMAKANTLVRDAMLNPELALSLLKKAPMSAGRGSEHSLAKLLARNSMFSAATAARF